jgi:hypothetical protein
MARMMEEKGIMNYAMKDTWYHPLKLWYRLAAQVRRRQNSFRNTQS